MRLRGRLAWAAFLAAPGFAACDLNPQPLPPGDENPNHASGDFDGGFPAAPRPGEDAGASSSGGGVTGEDASSDSGNPGPNPGDGGSDAGDAGDASDATTD